MNPGGRYVDYAEISTGIRQLYDRIVAAPDGWRPEAIVAVARGGLVPAAHLSYRFDRPIFFIDDYLLLSDLGGHRNILVVDEINDSGQALHRIRREVFGQPAHAQREVRYAVLYTRYTTTFAADYFLDFAPYYVDNDAYQFFPWEEAGS